MELDDLTRRSHQNPVLIFKHSRTCGTSAMAFDELEEVTHRSPSLHVVVVDVLTDRALSREIAARFGIRHESPQVLLLSGGDVRWHASHYRVTAAAIGQAVAALDQSVPL
jgi:bacillithiol system protein YtxJ